MARRKIALIPGHTIESPGAFAMPPIGKHERYWAMDMAQALSVVFGNAFETIIFFRDGKSIVETYGVVAAWKPDASLELHFNAEASGKAKGSLVVCNPKWEDFAKGIQAAQVAALNRTPHEDRGLEIIPPGNQDIRGWANVAHLDFPNALIEPFFGSNPDDCQLAFHYQEALCNQILDSLLKSLA
jgi:N-acetylmuramoyl-L-alanine amidase